MSSSGCNPTCGCPVPCPGGDPCRCATGRRDDDPNVEHKRCSCGEHCGCNPCTCPKSSNITATGRNACKCGGGCSCATCAA